MIDYDSKTITELLVGADNRRPNAKLVNVRGSSIRERLRID